MKASVRVEQWVSIGAWWRVALAAALCALGLAARDASAQSWVLDTVLEPPALPNVDPNDHMGFGHAVAIGPNWLVVGAPWADCTVQGSTVPDAGRIFIYKLVSGAWQYHQSFCASAPIQDGRYGYALDIHQASFIVGAPGATTTSTGLVDIFRFNNVTGSWSRQLSTTGAPGGWLGFSVAIDEGLAIAGEPFVNAQRGRIRTWKITASGITAEGNYAPSGLADNDGYGKHVALHASGCELPSCTSFVDVAAVLGGSRVYVAKRNAGAWQASQSLTAPSGGQFGATTTVVDVSHYQLLVEMDIQTATPMIHCPVGRAVRVFNRDGGGNFSLTGDACPPQTDGQATFGSAVFADRGTHQFMVSSPDAYAFGGTPEPDPALVHTYDGTPPGILYIDVVAEQSLAPTGPPPEIYNDAYGRSISATATRMAVGAPWMHVFTGNVGIGYVAVYVAP